MSAEAELRDLLAAVREAIDIPYASCVGEDEKRQAIMGDRIMKTAVILQRVLNDPSDRVEIGWSARRLREWLAEVPLTYVTLEQSQERMAAGVPYAEAVRPVAQPAP